MRFPKKERLHKLNDVSELFKSGHFLYSDSFKFIYTLSAETEPGIRIGISVPKKLIKRAVERNLIKRRTIEQVRQKKSTLSDICKVRAITLNGFIIYKKKHAENYTTIGKSIDTVFDKMIKIIATSTQEDVETIEEKGIMDIFEAIF